MPQAYVFDAFGTLLDVKRLTYALESHVDEGEVVKVNNIWRRKQLEYTWLRSLMESYRPFSTVTAEALQFACESCGIELEEKAFDEIMQAYFQVDCFPEVPALLKQWSNGHKLAILSNGDMSMLEGAVTHNGIGSYLDKILSADQVKIFKPSPKVYQMACEEFGLPADQIGFVSSNTWDVAGASSFGFQAVWLQRTSLPQEKLGFTASRVISSLSELIV